MDWLDLLAVQGTLKSLFQHDSSQASILLRSASFIVQHSHPYMTTGKTIALTRQTFVDKVVSLLFNMLSKKRETDRETLLCQQSDLQFSSVARSCPTLRPHEPRHARPPCPPPTPRVYPNPCPLSRWCHPTISSSALLLLPSIFPSIRVF